MLKIVLDDFYVWHLGVLLLIRVRLV